MATSARAEKLRGKTALVTGGSRGIGLAIADALAKEGARVAVTGRNAKSLKHAAKDKMAAILCDVRSEKDVVAAVAKLEKTFHSAGGLDILINNAGTILPIKPLEEVTLEEWDRTIETNLTGLFLMTKHCLPLIREGGIIINVLSVASQRAFPGSAAYNASKYGALGFTDSLRVSLREQKRDVRVVALLPGAIETELWNTLWPDAPRERMLDPMTVAHAVVEICKLPKGAVIEQMQIGPAAGEL